jgi:hypothetical protein
MKESVTHVVLAPAAYVTDLDEWYARLDSVVSVSGDARWQPDHDGIGAMLHDDEAADVLARAKDVLGDALEVRSGDHGQAVLVADAVGGRPIDE